MKLIVIVVVLLVLLFGFDGLRVTNDRRQIDSVAANAAGAAAAQIRTTHDETKGRAAAVAAVKSHNSDVLTKFHYDPVTSTVNVTVSGAAKTLVLHFFSKRVDDLNGSASARP